MINFIYSFFFWFCKFFFCIECIFFEEEVDFVFGGEEVVVINMFVRFVGVGGEVGERVVG